MFACGNADVDIETLESAKFGLLINHHDADREFVYTTGAEASMAKAAELGWTVVSMKDDRTSYHVPGITYSERWGPPGQATAVLGVQPNQQVLDLQAALLAAVTPFTGSGGTDAAFVTDPGQQISENL